MILYSKSDYDDFIHKLKREGEDINGTYEFIGEDLRTRLITTEDIIDIFNLDTEILDGFIKAIMNFEKTKVGPYETDKYSHLIPALKEAVLQLKIDNMGSRRCVITFPKEHCFQSIQFLLRQNTVNVACFMRSCDAIKNLPYDLWLCSFLADVFVSHIEALTDKESYDYHRIVMSFGSIHVYKEDLSNVF